MTSNIDPIIELPIYKPIISQTERYKFINPAEPYPPSTYLSSTAPKPKKHPTIEPVQSLRRPSFFHANLATASRTTSK